MLAEYAIREASELLKKNKVVSHNLDAEILLSNILGVSREFLIVNNNLSISKKVKQQYKNVIARRIKQEPIAYITGKKEFWSENFLVNRFTLIPRPETELLIYKIVSYFKNRAINILDIGTGSGCILLSIIKDLKKSKGIGIDISPNAIQIAKINSRKLNLSLRAKFRVFDINKYTVGKYDLIVSNPPYVPLKEIKNLCKDITKYEPLIALNGGIDGLDLIKKVIYKSTYLLKRKGLLAIEIGNQQYLKVSNMLKRNGFIELNREYDYKNNVRCIISTKT